MSIIWPTSWPSRGCSFLGWNTRYRGNGEFFRLAGALDDIAVGVRWLRQEAGATQVVLLGNSGGASLMSAYQSRALQRPRPRMGQGPGSCLSLSVLTPAARTC